MSEVAATPTAPVSTLSKLSGKTLGHYAWYMTWLLVAFLLLVGLPTYVFLLRPLDQIRAYNAGNANVAPGMDQTAVVALMGSPDRTQPPSAEAFWDNKTLDPEQAARVKQEYGYTIRTFLLPVPTTWTVGFDEDGRAISKHRWD